MHTVCVCGFRLSLHSSPPTRPPWRRLSVTSCGAGALTPWHQSPKPATWRSFASSWLWLPARCKGVPAPWRETCGTSWNKRKNPTEDGVFFAYLDCRTHSSKFTEQLGPAAAAALSEEEDHLKCNMTSETLFPLCVFVFLIKKYKFKSQSRKTLCGTMMSKSLEVHLSESWLFSLCRLSENIPMV